MVQPLQVQGLQPETQLVPTTWVGLGNWSGSGTRELQASKHNLEIYAFRLPVRLTNQLHNSSWEGTLIQLA